MFNSKVIFKGIIDPDNTLDQAYILFKISWDSNWAEWFTRMCALILSR